MRVIKNNRMMILYAATRILVRTFDLVLLSHFKTHAAALGLLRVDRHALYLVRLLEMDMCRLC
jgi:hypothetical protein